MPQIVRIRTKLAGLRGPAGADGPTGDVTPEAEAARDLAQEYAENAEDVAVTGTSPAEFSAKNYSIKAAASASAAASSESNAGTSESNASGSASSASTSASNASTSASNAASSASAASDSADTAAEYAENAEDAPVSGTSPAEFSAKHYSAKAATSAGNASTSATAASDSAGLAAEYAENAEDVAVTGTSPAEYSAKHYSEKAAAALALTIKEVTGTTYTVLATDDNKLLVFTNASGCAITLPQQTTTSLSEAFSFGWYADTTGTVSFTAEGSDTIDTPSGGGTNAAGEFAEGFVFLKDVSGSPLENTWALNGELTA